MAARITEGQKLNFLHKAIQGHTPAELTSGYGIMMARMVGFPGHILEEASQHKVELEKQLKTVEARRRSQEAQGHPAAEKQAVDILRRLVMVGHLTGAPLRDFLQNLRDKVEG